MRHRPHAASVGIAAGLLAAPLFVLACAAQADPAMNRVSLGATAGDLLYVCSQDAAIVSIIDMDRNVVVATIDLQALGYPANAKPHHTAIEPDGSHWYLSLIGANRVVKFNARNEAVEDVEFEAPGMLALHPTDDVLFVGRSMSAVNPPARIGVIRRSDMTIEELDVVYPRPHALAIHPGGAYVYTASLGENQIMTLDVRAMDLAFTVVAGPHHTLAHAAISPDGSRLVIGGEMSGQLLVFDVSDPATPEFITSVAVNEKPWHPVFTPDGRFVYFGNQGVNTITAVDTRDWSVAAVIEGAGIAQPHGSAVSSDGRYVYIANRNLRGDYPGSGEIAHPGTVVVVNTATRTIETVIEVPAGASGLGTRLAR